MRSGRTAAAPFAGMTQTGSMGVISAAAAAPQAISLHDGGSRPFRQAPQWDAVNSCRAAATRSHADGTGCQPGFYPCASASRAGRLIERCAQSPGQLQGIVMRPEMHENQPGLFGQHVAVDCSHLDAIFTQCLDNRVHLLAGEDKIAGNRRLTVGSGLEVDGGGHSHRASGTDLYPSLLNWVAARYAKLVDAAIGLPLDTEDLVELRRIEIERRRRRGGRRWIERHLARRQAFADCCRHFHRIAVPADVHVERRRIGTQDVIVDSRDLKTVLDQLGHHRHDFALQQHQIAHRHGTAMRRLEGDPTSERQCRLDRDAIEGHREIAARKAIAMHIAGYHRSLPAERCIDLLPVDFLGANGRGGGENGTSKQESNDLPHDELLMTGSWSSRRFPVLKGSKIVTSARATLFQAICGGFVSVSPSQGGVSRWRNSCEQTRPTNITTTAPVKMLGSGPPCANP